MLWETTLYEQEDRSAHKNCNRTPFKPACTLLTPRPPSKTEHLLFLALSHSVAHCYCVLSLPLICLIYSHIPLPSPPPLPRQTSLVQGTLLEGTADHAQQNITHKPLVNDKLLIITYSWKYRKVLLVHWDANSSLRSIISNESTGNILNVL